VARAIRTQRGIIVNAFDAAPDAHPELRSLLPGAALLVAPLLRPDGEPLGALALREALKQERFDAGDLERARLFATQAAIAIETARLHAGMRAAQQEIEEERARWRATVENMPELVLTCDTTGRTTFVNAAYERLSGRGADPTLPLAAAAQYYGLYRPDGSNIYPPESLPLARALCENRLIQDVELRQRTQDGGQRLIAWDAEPVRGADGELLGAVAVGHDITEERRRSERERCLTAVTRAAGSAHTAEGSSRVTQALRALVEQSEVAMIAATLYIYDDERDALQRAGSYGVETTWSVPPVVPLNSRHRWWEPVTQGAMYSSPEGSVPRWLTDVSPTVWRHSSRRAWATLPLRMGGAFLGVLAVGLVTPHVWDEAEREWLEACAGAVSIALANDRLYAAAQRRADELKAVLDAVDVGISMTAADGRMLVRNPAAIEITGRREDMGTLTEEAESYALRDALTGEPVPLEESPVARALRGEQVRDVLLVMRDAQGRDRVMQSSSVPVRDASGQVVAAVTMFREVEANGTNGTNGANGTNGTNGTNGSRTPRRAGEPRAEHVQG
jgi:PAS domain-containing protein